MKSTATLFLVALVLVGCRTNDPAATPVAGGKGPAPVTADLAFGDYKLGQPVTEGNVTLVPVMNTKKIQDQELSKMMTLAEARQLGLVEILEKPNEEEEVNSLKVLNKGERPLLLLGGELLLGGKQDRIVANDTIVQPHETKDVPVYCVEHGRWEGNSKHFDYAQTMVPTQVRKAATFKGQTEVWDKVAEYNTGAGFAADSGGTVSKGLSSPQVQERMKNSLPNVIAGLERQKDVIGVIFVVNGKIQAMDLFGNTKLFNGSREGLLKGYLSQAATETNDAKPIALTDCLAFLKESLTAKQTVDSAGFAVSRGDVTLSGSAKVEGADYKLGKDKSGPLVHGSYSPKEQGGKE
jgi:hypothetical protein